MDDLIRQNDVVSKLGDTALAIKRVKAANERKDTLQTELKSAILPSSYLIPLDPKLEASQIVIEKCKYMDSKKVREQPSSILHSIHALFIR